MSTNIRKATKECAKSAFNLAKYSFTVEEFDKAYGSFNVFYNLFLPHQYTEKETNDYRDELEEMLIVSLYFTGTSLSEQDTRLAEKCSEISNKISKLLREVL